MLEKWVLMALKDAGQDIEVTGKATEIHILGAGVGENRRAGEELEGK